VPRQNVYHAGTDVLRLASSSGRDCHTLTPYRGQELSATCSSVVAMANESNARADILALSDYVYQRTRRRLAGLTDHEYFWEPVPGCCTVRRTQSGDYRADDPHRAGNASFTTIAWRLWHLIENYGAKRQPQWLGVERPPGGFERGDPAPPTAAQAITVLDRAHDFWRGVLQELPAASWWEPLGPIAGEYAESSKASLVLHHLDEQIHHGAELGVLRDLYRHDVARST
jgi:hypothetical protein